MLKPKTKGLFIDVSEFSILAVRTSSYKLPIVVEEVAEFRIEADCSAEDVRAFLEQFVDFKGASYFVSRCGVYPKGRFLRYFEAETSTKAKDPSFLSEVLQSEFNVDPAVNSVSILDARNGSDFDFCERALQAACFLRRPIGGISRGAGSVVVVWGLS